MRIQFLLTGLLLGTVSAAQAQHQHPMAGMSHATMASMPMGPAATPGSPVAAFQRGMDSVMVVMDEGMRRMDGASPTDIDASFAAMMVPHHQGAVDMARLQLLYGKDPALRRLAQSIIAEQQVEIQQIQAWLRQHPVPTTSAGPASPAHSHH
ncbi:DUF305 domain-containing protein [Hymenobacter sediminis]|uniref:DUF305 domain-containing protein n=1 Tax=Hymenobacter sediminis TaxID=2218621 RepID=UPI000DA6782C|nr:DUF305 domain-containing protein [Hymenobacter sediminis]RPD44304.1 DUF305 domain-containing protein [Hymenobacter sediminis]